jgi:hypothetical protein
LIFDKEGKTINGKKKKERKHVYQNGAGLTGSLHAEESKLIHIYHPA